jgi:RimJ/RimL family protein N-acetyltransferase
MTPVLRPVQDTDRGLLFEWLNRPDSLANKLRTKAPVAAAEHAAWFAERRRDSDCLMWIIEIDGRPAGQVRLQPADGAHEVDIYVAPEFRRRGVALSALGQAASLYRQRFPQGRLDARVRAHNQASRQLFAAAGYALTARRDGYDVMELRP